MSRDTTDIGSDEMAVGRRMGTTDNDVEQRALARRVNPRQTYPIRILISYRRDDTRGWVGRIAGVLVRSFGADHVFQDIKDIEPGQPWEKIIDEAIGSCDLVLVVIGRQWLTIVDDRGQRRLDDPDDRHRREVETTMDQGKALFPVLVDGAVMPRKDELPDQLKRLASYNAYNIVEPFKYSSRGLIDAIKLVARRKAEKERIAAEQAAAAAEQARIANEKIERERQERERAAAEEAERKKVVAAQAAAQRAEKERIAAEQAAAHGAAAPDVAAPEAAARAAAAQPPGPPMDLLAAAIGATIATLSWSPSTDTRVAGYRVRRDGVEVATTTETSWTEADLAPATTYGYSVLAFDAVGNESAPATVSATTPPDTQAPTPPGDLTATPASATSIDLSWTASSDDVGVTGYRVSRDGVVVATTAETSYADAGLSSGTAYSYSVVAVDAAGNESAPASASAMTVSAPPPPPSEPMPLREAVDQAGLKYQVLPDGTLAFPFRSERAAELLILARALSDEIVLFSVRLPKPGMFGQEAGLRNLLRASFQANYTKVMASASLDLMAASELHPSMLTPGVVEGLIRGLASLGDLRSGDLRDWQTMTAAIRGSRGTQENHIVVDPDAAREAIRRMAEEDGLAVQESAGVIVFEFPLLGLEGSHLKLLVNASSQVISIGAFLGMKPQGNKVQFMQQLLQLNQVADVARVGLDADDEVAFLYEVPVVTPGLLERVKTQFMLLSVGVAAIAAGDLRRRG